MASLLEQFVTAHHDAFDGWLDLIASLDADDWDRPTGCPGWSVRDNLAHVVALEREMLGELPAADHELPEGLDHVAGELDAHMERGIDVRRGVEIADLVAEFERTVAERRAVLDALDEDQFTAPFASIAGAMSTPKRFLGIRIFDIWAHEQDARRAVGRPGHLTGPAADVSLDRIGRGLRHHLPLRLGTDGVLVLRVTGALQSTWAVDLATGEALETVPDDPRVVLTVDWADLVPLACGRSDAPDGAVDVAGDAELGRRAGADLAITP